MCWDKVKGLKEPICSIHFQPFIDLMNVPCSGQVFSDTKIGCSSAIFRSKTLGDR